MLWHPDTCTCQFEVADDWKSAKPVVTCEHHAKSSDPFVAVRTENAFKNVAVGFLMEQGIKYAGFLYDPDLVIVVEGDASAVTGAQTLCDKEFGVGEVTCRGS